MSQNNSVRDSNYHQADESQELVLELALPFLDLPNLVRAACVNRHFSKHNAGRLLYEKVNRLHYKLVHYPKGLNRVHADSRCPIRVVPPAFVAPAEQGEEVHQTFQDPRDTAAFGSMNNFEKAKAITEYGERFYSFCDSFPKGFGWNDLQDDVVLLQASLDPEASRRNFDHQDIISDREDRYDPIVLVLACAFRGTSPSSDRADETKKMLSTVCSWVNLKTATALYMGLAISSTLLQFSSSPGMQVIIAFCAAFTSFLLMMV